MIIVIMLIDDGHRIDVSIIVNIVLHHLHYYATHDNYLLILILREEEYVENVG